MNRYLSDPDQLPTRAPMRPRNRGNYGCRWVDRSNPLARGKVGR